jgi:hypothetical protein
MRRSPARLRAIADKENGELGGALFALGEYDSGQIGFALRQDQRGDGKTRPAMRAINALMAAPTVSTSQMIRISEKLMMVFNVLPSFYSVEILR